MHVYKKASREQNPIWNFHQLSSNITENAEITYDTFMTITSQDRWGNSTFQLNTSSYASWVA